MTDKQLLALSKKYKKQADNLLKKFQLVKFLGQFGQVRLVGSYPMDLMVDPDIDIEIVNPNFNKNKVVAILNKLINKDQFLGCDFQNWHKYKQKGKPKSYYIGLKIKDAGKMWKIDMHFFNSHKKRADKYFNLIKNKLTPINKLIILKLKQQNLIRHDNISSRYIYEAVLQKNIKTYNGLLKYIKD